MMFLRKTTCPSIDAGRQGDGGAAVSVVSILGSQIFPTNIPGVGMHFAQSKECAPRALMFPVGPSYGLMMKVTGRKAWDRSMTSGLSVQSHREATSVK